jgi:hypothetical protein
MRSCHLRAAGSPRASAPQVPLEGILPQPRRESAMSKLWLFPSEEPYATKLSPLSGRLRSNQEVSLRQQSPTSFARGGVRHANRRANQNHPQPQ